MSEPILSREEMQEIERKCDITFFVPDDSETWPGTYINLQQLRDYAAALESALLDKLRGEPAAHMFPSDLERFKTSETFAQAYSVAVGNPDEHSVPLYTLRGQS
ncbi:hypothetical protein WT25_11210 [Burkholderia territorii]|uniref:hypothetical protein n=1 Tax=Burkholderia territorii TaxID=1503055 RepID=UPI000759DCA5|nr:hypothetical protein [Burkholderia territorii]KVT86314.1 hypothetical protein WT25_11210 [Burkholderia territorii]